MILLFTVIAFSSTVVGISKVMEVIQPAFLIAKRHKAAHFICDYSYAGDAEQFRVTLHKQIGNRSIQICTSSFTTEYEPSSTEVPIHCHVHPSHNRVNLTLWGLEPRDTGLYFCQLERIYPPPYYPVMGKGTQLYVIEPTPCVDLHLYLWIAAAAASGLLVYCILLTVFLLRKAIGEEQESRSTLKINTISGKRRTSDTMANDTGELGSGTGMDISPQNKKYKVLKRTYFVPGTYVKIAPT